MQHVIPKKRSRVCYPRPRRRMNRQESGAQTRAQRRAHGQAGWLGTSGAWLRPDLPSRRSCLGHQCRRVCLAAAELRLTAAAKAWVGICVKE